jgi:hypothetical protein
MKKIAKNLKIFVNSPFSARPTAPNQSIQPKKTFFAAKQQSIYLTALSTILKMLRVILQLLKWDVRDGKRLHKKSGVYFFFPAKKMWNCDFQLGPYR